MARLSVPTTARLSSSLRLPSSHPALVKRLARLSRHALISLVLDWLDQDSVANAMPHLQRPAAPLAEDHFDDADDLYPPCRSLPQLRDLYSEMRHQKGSKRDLISRILEGDWRHGLTLYQLAILDFSYLEEHPSSQSWSAYSILPLRPPSTDADEKLLKVDAKSLSIPRFHPSTFLQNLQHQSLPDVKAHYHFHRPAGLPLLLLRIFALDSPYNTVMALSNPDGPAAASNFGTARIIYLAFPDGSPSLFVSKSQPIGPSATGESKSLHRLIVDGVPRALSRPRHRFTLKPLHLSTKNLAALMERRGSGRGNAAAGGWSIYALDTPANSPLDTCLPPPRVSHGLVRKGATLSHCDRLAKRAKFVAESRFGPSGLVDDGKGVEKVQVLIQDPFHASRRLSTEEADGVDAHVDDDQPTATLSRRRSRVDAILHQARQDADQDDDGAETSPWTLSVGLVFHGSHVFAGIRQLVEAGVVDGERMPGWMTGEEGVTSGIVRHGRIAGHWGSGL